MRTLEQIKEEVKLLPLADKKVLLSRLAQLVSETGEGLPQSRRGDSDRFFKEWDASHSVTVGEKPSRVRTYDGNPPVS